MLAIARTDVLLGQHRTHNGAGRWDLTSNPAQAFIDSNRCFSAFTVEELANIVLYLIGGEPPDRGRDQP